MIHLLDIKDMNKRFAHSLFILILLFPLTAGCVRLLTNVSPSLIPSFTQTFFEECDPELARVALPADLKLMEGLLKNDPANRQLLTALCMGFTGYSMLFIEDENPERASRLYLRARDYGIEAIGRRGAFLRSSSASVEDIQKKLKRFGEREIEALFCTTMSWHAWISLNIDKPAALAQMGIAQSCLERILEMNPAHFYAAPCVLMGTILAAKPGLAGGDANRARVYFEKAMEISQGQFYFVHYNYAKYYAVRVQDRALFTELIQKILDGQPDQLPEACLINSVMQQKAKRLLAMSEDLFI
jgi:hypothetical protein